MYFSKRVLIAVVSICVFYAKQVKADEGMWLPQLLQKLNESRMKSLGMKISAADIYSVNKGSLKDAVVSFGGFCTGEVISSQGLVLTNHHCGFDAIQNHSSLENNYIRDGFWSKTLNDEIPNKGLFATFIVRIDDVTAAVLNGINSNMPESERQVAIQKNMKAAEDAAQKAPGQAAFARGFFEGNQYYVFVTETFNDVRLVGAPPSSIGNFGKDTDNWVWPRHTGDFSLFRIYADKNNKPAPYSKDNVPYVAKKALNISLSGIAENDFTMVFGFPGRTSEYLHSDAVEQIRTVLDPLKIGIRNKALSVIDGYMRKDEAIKIQYASKYAGIQNAYKKWQGEVLGLTRTDANSKKRAYEAEFAKRVNANPKFASYKSLLADLSSAYAAIQPLAVQRDLYQEVVPRIELLTIAAQINSLAQVFEKNGRKGFDEKLPQVRATVEDLLKEYNANVDKDLFVNLMAIYFEKNTNASKPASLSAMADELYADNTLTDAIKLNTLLASSPEEITAFAKASKAVALQQSLAQSYRANVQEKLVAQQNSVNLLQRSYTKAQMEVYSEKTFYPDANSTLRVTYGKVKGYKGRDAVQFDFKTDLDGIMEKYKPGDYEFDVPEKLRQLHAAKDYGRYGLAGKMPVCFIATNHTTGGNSGSPALDAYGNLIGLNFDRVWEGTMSDINYDASICRNIMVDIRYVLFIIDKFAGATRLIDELKIVYPKKK
jgi:Peptidase S46